MKMTENGKHLSGRLRFRALGIRIDLLEVLQDWGDRSGILEMNTGFASGPVRIPKALGVQDHSLGSITRLG